jgi:transketolase
MRNTFIETLTVLAENNTNIVLLTADLGFRVVDAFAKRFPARFFNVGVAEQNMMGLASGLAQEGFIPFVYSMVPFATLRTYEFIKNGPVFHDLPVRIIGAGGGCEYGVNGFTHYGFEDIGVMRLQPGMTVAVPSDKKETLEVLEATWNLPGPVYYRVSKTDYSGITDAIPEIFQIDKTRVVKAGKDILFITSGSITKEVVAAVKLLQKESFDPGIISLPIIKPLPSDLAETIKRYATVITVEDHYVTGGVRSAIAEVITEHSLPVKMHYCGVPSIPKQVGSMSYLYEQLGISAEKIAAYVCKIM